VFLNLGFVLLLSPTVFFNVASGVNFFVHIFSFFSGYLCYLMYALYKNKDVVMGRKPITPQSYGS
jgi:hypothetical protein